MGTYSGHLIPESVIRVDTKQKKMSPKYLQHNGIQHFPEFEHPFISDIQLSGNPLTCNCTHFWLTTSSRVTDAANLTCRDNVTVTNSTRSMDVTITNSSELRRCVKPVVKYWRKRNYTGVSPMLNFETVGYPRPEIKLLKNSHPIMFSTLYQLWLSPDLPDDIARGAIQLNTPSMSFGGNYTIVAWNVMGNDSSTLRLDDPTGMATSNFGPPSKTKHKPTTSRRQSAASNVTLSSPNESPLYCSTVNFDSLHTSVSYATVQTQLSACPLFCIACPLFYIIACPLFYIAFHSSISPVHSSVSPVHSSISPPLFYIACTLFCIACPLCYNIAFHSSILPVHSSISPVHYSISSPVHSSILPVHSSISPVHSSISPVHFSASPVHSSVSPVRSSISPVHSSISPIEIFLPVIGSMILVSLSFLIIRLVCKRLRVRSRLTGRMTNRRPIMVDRKCNDLYEGMPLSRIHLVENPNYCTSRKKPNQPKCPKTVRLQTILLMRVIGEGAFGRVFLGTCAHLIKKNEFTIVAVKTLKGDSSEALKRDFEREAEMMSSLEHSNIVTFYGVCTESEQWMMIFEFMENGDLNKFLRMHGPDAALLRNSDSGGEVKKPLTNDQLMLIVVQIANGLEYLASQHFVHRDVATRNCLVGADLVVKLGDFGMSRDVYCTDYYRVDGTAMLPVRWMPPESIMYRTFTVESDVWSFGVTLWEAYTYGKQPWFEYSNVEVIEHIKNHRTLRRPPICPDSIYKIMLGCWKSSPQDRLSMKEIVLLLEMELTQVVAVPSYSPEPLGGCSTKLFSQALGGCSTKLFSQAPRWLQHQAILTSPYVVAVTSYSPKPLVKNRIVKFITTISTDNNM
ncbi:hypothetical protein Btru_027729 [Bulinus truncatus]|nr:hypothetical protein Btru_027729 [Bulinus truncatus]